MLRHARLTRWGLGLSAAAAFTITAFSAQTPASLAGMRDPAFAPDGRRIAVSWLEQVWTMAPDGRDAKRVVTAPAGWVSERDPAWSPDGRQLAFAADTNGSFDLYVAPAGGGAARRVTTLVKVCVGLGGAVLVGVRVDVDVAVEVFVTVGELVWVAVVVGEAGKSPWELL